MYRSIITEIDESVGILTLNKTERHNAFDAALVTEMTQALLDFENNPVVRVVVLSSAGKNFCAGTDIHWLKQSASNSAEDNLRDARAMSLLMDTLNRLSKPTIVRVQGPAYGYGVGLIAACDIAVATYDAVFAFTDVKLGLIPATITPFILAAIGERYCRRYMLTAERFSAAEAYRIGLIHEIVPGEDQLDDAIAEIADSLLKNGPQAQAACKALIHSVSGQPIDATTLEETTQRITEVRSNPEGSEGLMAFMEKRKPNWAR